VGVVIAAIIIYFRPDWKLADPITTFVFAVIVLGTTVPVSIECMKILMEYSPDGLDVKELYDKIYNVSAFPFIAFSWTVWTKLSICTCGP